MQLTESGGGWLIITAIYSVYNWLAINIVTKNGQGNKQLWPSRVQYIVQCIMYKTRWIKSPL